MCKDTIRVAEASLIAIGTFLAIFEHGLFIIFSIDQVTEDHFVVDQLVLSAINNGLAGVTGDFVQLLDTLRIRTARQLYAPRRIAVQIPTERIACRIKCDTRQQAVSSIRTEERRVGKDRRHRMQAME